MTSRPEHVIVDELDPDHSPLPISQPTIQDVSETAVDLKDAHTGWTLGGSVLGEYLPLPKGTGAVVGGAIGYGISKIKRKVYQGIVDAAFSPARRLADWGKGKVDDITGLYNTGTGIDTSAPRPTFGNLGTKISEAEALVYKNQFANEVLKGEVITSPKGVNIAKRKESGYKFAALKSSEWNAWSKSAQFIDELADRPATSYVEHLVGKGNRLDFFWRIPDEIRFRKGTRHSPNNVRILYSDRYKKLKDATENILYKMQANTPDMNRLVVDLDIPQMEGMSITVKQAPRDLVIKRVDGTVVGKLGDYHDVLYAKTPVLQEALTTTINPRTGKFYIDPNTPDIKKAIRAWREKILKDKINLIINEAPTLEGKLPGAKFQYQESAIQEDLVNFLEEYKFIPKAKGSTLKRQLLSEPAFGLRGGKPIVSESEKFKKKVEGTFLNKTQERKIMDAKRKGRLNIDELFPPRKE